MLTRKQHELLVFVHQRLKESGIPPSFDEMKDALDLRSRGLPTCGSDVDDLETESPGRLRVRVAPSKLDEGVADASAGHPMRKPPAQRRL